MIGMDLICKIRRAYREEPRPVKEIARTVPMSRAADGKVVRGHAIEFKYERSAPPAPKLGEGAEVLTGILVKEAKPPAARPRASSSKRLCRLQAGFVPNLEFGIYFSARKQHERPHPEPEQKDDDRAERAVGGVI